MVTFKFPLCKKGIADLTMFWTVFESKNLLKYLMKISVITDI